MTGPLASVYERFGNTYREFECCDTTFRIQAMGIRDEAGATAARKTAESLEAQLNTFDATSAVNQLNREGEVRNEHVVRIVRRGIEYNDRTGGVFDIHQGRVGQGLKTFLRGDSETLPTEFDTGTDDSHATITFSAPREEAEDAEAPSEDEDTETDVLFEELREWHASGDGRFECELLGGRYNQIEGAGCQNDWRSTVESNE
ncbi:MULTISPECIES: FAD:protein FMN transferase [unclassified Haloarcula]|uniref:FAD:protein FMN transferase n=1 Tax=unclassified Haloarcula TaxID=2624677 RepID=UPI0009AC18E7|nr:MULTISPECIES: FAD:protein FMN transferase [unclassified Haloarcula]KAA9401113.1 hypothetical protein Har1131_21245 [Haloarcula sp. CBA1131]